MTARERVDLKNSSFVGASAWHILEHCAIFKS